MRKKERENHIDKERDIDRARTRKSERDRKRGKRDRACKRVRWRERKGIRIAGGKGGGKGGEHVHVREIERDSARNREGAIER